MIDPTQARLHELFTFDAEAGVLLWRRRPAEDFADARAWKIFNARFADTMAGSISGYGYRTISFNLKSWRAHRLIWIYAHGDIPDGKQIDHINGKRDDNRLENLRLVTSAENNRNSSMRSNNTSGVMGIAWHKGARKWQAKIKINGRMKHLGLFDTVAAAADVRSKAEREHGFHPGHGKPSLPQEQSHER